MNTVSGWNFDWDDNIFYMPTDVVLYHRSSGEERMVSTAEFATIRSQLGKAGEWKDLRTAEGSFQYFRDSADGRNYFREDIDKAIGSNEPTWIGPSWEPFLFALSRPETARRVTIITARGHSRPAMRDGLRLLQSRGYFRHLPPEENLYPVSHPDLAGDAAKPSDTKAKVMQEILNEIAPIDVSEDSPKVVSRDGTAAARLHLWGFSDDDWGNYEAARNALSEQVARGRWSNIKITVLYTGVHDPSREPRTEVIQPDGDLRPQKPEELHEGMLMSLGASAVPHLKLIAQKSPPQPPGGRNAKGSALWSEDTHVIQGHE